MSQIDQYTCEQVFRRLDDYLDRELTPEETELVRQHLEICAACAAEHQFQASVIQQVRSRLQRVPAPEGLRSKVSDLLDMAMRKE